jgi:hypothetical protein
MTYPVRWFTSEFENAPELNAAVGSIIGILDACLINGFNTKGVDALAYDSQTGLCTVTVQAGHGYQKHQIIRISGADQGEYNGDFRVVDTTSTTLTFAPATAPAVTPATGATLEIKTAPAPTGCKPAACSKNTVAQIRSLTCFAAHHH